MKLPNETQFSAAERIIDSYTKQYGTGGTDQHRRRAAHAIYAIFAGRLASIPEEFRPAAAADQIDCEAVAEARLMDYLKQHGIEMQDIPESEQVILTINDPAASDLNIPAGDWIHESDAKSAVDTAVSNAMAAFDDADFSDLGFDDEDDSDADVEDKTLPFSQTREALEARTVTQLRSIASDLGVAIVTNEKKEAIIDALLAVVELNGEAMDKSLENHPAK